MEKQKRTQGNGASAYDVVYTKDEKIMVTLFYEDEYGKNIVSKTKEVSPEFLESHNIGERRIFVYSTGGKYYEQVCRVIKCDDNVVTTIPVKIPSKRKRISKLRATLLLTNGRVESFVKNRKKQVVAFTAGALVAGALLGTTLIMLNDKNSEQAPTNNAGQVLDESSGNDAHNSDYYANASQNVRTSVGSNGNTYLYLDSMVIISDMAYNQVAQEYKQYVANGGTDFKMNMGLIDGSIIGATATRESSLQYFDGNDTEYFGCFKIGKEALEEANKVSIELTGKPVANTLKELKDPVIGAKVCMYIHVSNYTYEYDYRVKNGVNKPITQAEQIEMYLFGATGMRRNGEQTYYSRSIIDYAEVYAQRLKNLQENPNSKFTDDAKQYLWELQKRSQKPENQPSRQGEQAE